MAYSYLWPPSLPAGPVRGSFNERNGLLILRSPMDRGPAKVRRRGRLPSILTMQFFMSSAQVDTLETFINDTIKGVYRFGFTHPRTGEVVECRVVPDGEGRLYSLDRVNEEFFTVDLVFEVLP